MDGSDWSIGVWPFTPFSPLTPFIGHAVLIIAYSNAHVCKVMKMLEIEKSYGRSSKFVSETPHLLLAFGLKVIVKHI